MEMIIVRYSEVGLKGKNRLWFEKLLIQNIKKHLSPEGKCAVTRIHGRIIVSVESISERVLTALSCVPGIANFSPAVTTSHKMDDIASLAIQLAEESGAGQQPSDRSFKISAKRSDKKFPLNSQQLGEQIGGFVLEKFPQLTVNLSAPDIDIGIEIWPNDQAVLFQRRIAGQGGLPSGSAGAVLSFISGGIDSPVASWMMMKRGCMVNYIHFHSYPFIGEQSRQKVVDLVTHLSRFQPVSTLLIVPFAEIQKEIQLNCLEKNRTVLYRRLMYRVANAIKDKYKALAFITGEAVGQVASQTLENLNCTEDIAALPVLRPLIGMDKAEIINWAKQIGTYKISVQPFPDCCTVFQPKNPEIHGDVQEMRDDEVRISIDELIEKAVMDTEVITIRTQIKKQAWD